MACIIVPATEAIVTTAVTKIIEKKEKENGGTSAVSTAAFSHKLKKLNYMLYGGVALLTFEHIWHGEIQPFFPFLTAAANKQDTIEMFREMSTVGVTMAVVTTLIWGVMTYASYKLENKADNEVTA